jgi:hypothetical protein
VSGKVECSHYVGGEWSKGTMRCFDREDGVVGRYMHGLDKNALEIEGLDTSSKYFTLPLLQWN